MKLRAFNCTRVELRGSWWSIGWTSGHRWRWAVTQRPVQDRVRAWTLYQLHAGPLYLWLGLFPQTLAR